MIALIDYGAGNLKSVRNAIESIGGQVIVTADPVQISRSDGIILPGVGNFGDAMDKLHRLGLPDVIRAFIQTGKPFLGICLGLQMLFEQSEESPSQKGLGILQGEVRRFPAGAGLKIPHMGYNSITKKANSRLFANIPDQSYFYFVHSYYCRCYRDSDSAAKTDYALGFDAAVEQDNLFAVQFHPEKSSKIGLAVLQNFLQIVKEQ